MYFNWTSSSFFLLDSKIIHFSEFLVVKWKVRAVFSSDFTSDPHSQHIDAILILWLPRDPRLTQSSVRDGFEAHVFTLRTDFTPRLEYRFGTKMWRFLPGCKPPPKKVKSKEDASVSTKNYKKNKRQRAFQNSWSQGWTHQVSGQEALSSRTGQVRESLQQLL